MLGRARTLFIRTRWVSRLLGLLLLGFELPSSPVLATTIVRAGTASISNDPDAGTWTIRSAGGSLTLAFDDTNDFRIVRLAGPSGEARTIGTGPDTQITVAGKTLPFGSRAAGFVFQNAAASADGFTVRLDVTFDLPSSHLRLSRHYVAASGSPTFETWTTFVPLGSAVSVSDLNGFVATIPAGTIHWVNGLQGDSTEAANDAAFTLQQRDLNGTERLVLGANGRASEQTVPWAAIENSSGVFYCGLLWSGSWSLVAARNGDAIDLKLGLPAMSTNVSGSIDGPHAFYGIASRGLGHASAALRTFILHNLRRDRPLHPQVTYNTWYAYGVRIDEESLRAEIDGAAALGAERFVVDAGWYAGAGRNGASDFTSGLGNWQVDASRFPSGLAALSDYAHQSGLSFGLWVEPERVTLSTVGRSGLAQETWLAKNDGKYGSSEFAQLCLGSPAGRQWVFDRLVALIDATHPDYLKWDNNFWINCDRSGHVHGATDGNFAHTNGLYEILLRLRERYPDLEVENVSGGGNRLDLGMLRYSDAAWMDDRTAPSAKVRHNLQGLSVVFPPAYLMSFVLPDRDEPLKNSSDLPLIFRSRMSGILGLSFPTAGFDDEDFQAMRREIDAYKNLREWLTGASGALLTPQTAPGNGPAWDVLQTTPEGFNRVVLWAFQTDRAVRATVVRPVALRPESQYEVQSANTGARGIMTGASLMQDGVELIGSPNSAADTVLLIRVRQ